MPPREGSPFSDFLKENYAQIRPRRNDFLQERALRGTPEGTTQN
jgi:hypothetical protein